MPIEGLEVRFGDFIEGLDEEDLALIVHEALSAFEDGEAAVAACVGWAEQADKLFELNQALLNRMAAAEGHPRPRRPRSWRSA